MDDGPDVDDHAVWVVVGIGLHLSRHDLVEQPPGGQQNIEVAFEQRSAFDARQVIRVDLELEELLERLFADPLPDPAELLDEPTGLPRSPRVVVVAQVAVLSELVETLLDRCF